MDQADSVHSTPPTNTSKTDDNEQVPFRDWQGVGMV